MKMSKETYNHLLGIFKEHRQMILDYKPILKEHGSYEDFETRLAFDCFNKLATGNANNPNRKRTYELLERDRLIDRHIETGIKKALKELGIL